VLPVLLILAECYVAPTDLKGFLLRNGSSIAFAVTTSW